MRIGCITTTIHVPEVIAAYHADDPTVEFFIAGDRKSPDEAEKFCNEMQDDGVFYYTEYQQRQLGYASSELTGWSNDSRRNIALLEALKGNAEIIVSIDDDMLISGGGFFSEVGRVFEGRYYGLKLGEPDRWFNAGAHTEPMTRQRGVPADAAFDNSPGMVFGAQVGVIQGIILGVPDADAMTAIANRPMVSGVTDVLRNGFVVDQDCHAVFNSQITAFRAELAPAFAQFYHAQGRNTDIFASLMMRRVMKERGLYTYFGKPMGFHARAKRPLLNDLRAEMFGLEKIEAFARCLNDTKLPKVPVVSQCKILMGKLHTEGLMSDAGIENAMAFYSDCEKVL